jgi:DNA-binding LacI/PurR family transcriptional regulator
MKRRVTLKQIARDMGLSTQTVSVALRDRPGVSEKLRGKIKARAAEMGYVPDAAMQALAEYRSRVQKVAVRWNRVALVHNWSAPEALEEHWFYRKWFAELKQAAATRGIEIEIHWLGSQNEQASKVVRLLRNRGISGVFFAPPGNDQNPLKLEIPAEHFQVVTFGPEHLYANHHTVQFDYFENLRLAWQVLWNRGFRRIGLVYPVYHASRTGHAWRAAYHVEQLLAGVSSDSMIPLELDMQSGNSRETIYRSWLKKGRYDAVITSIFKTGRWARAAGQDCEFVYFNVPNSKSQGIDLNLSLMARTAVELLTLEMQRSLNLEKETPFRIHIPGKWVDALE